ALERSVFGGRVTEVHLVVDPRFKERRTAQQERLRQDAAIILSQDGVQKAGSPKAAPQQPANQLAGLQIQLAHRHIERIVQQGYVLHPVLPQRKLQNLVVSQKTQRQPGNRQRGRRRQESGRRQRAEGDGNIIAVLISELDQDAARHLRASDTGGVAQL